MPTTTAPRPTTQPARTPGTTPTRTLRPAAATTPAAGRRAPAPRPSFACDLTAPAWVDAWTEQAPEDTTDPHLVHAVVDAVRAGHGLAEVADATGVDVRAVMKVVSAVGSRCTQIGKHAPKVHKILPAEDQAPASSAFTQTPAAELDPAAADPTALVDGWIVYAAAGWLRSRRQGDIRRAYAALFVAEPDVAVAAVARTLDAAGANAPLGYTHFSDLHGASRGALPPLHLVVTAPGAVAGYLAAWRILSAATRTATTAIESILRGPSPAQVRTLLEDCFWLIPSAAALGAWADACATAPDGNARLHAERRLRHQIDGLRHVAARNPRRLFPTRLEDLTIVQVRAIAALHGFHPRTGSGARDETTLDVFADEARRVLRAQDLMPA